MNENKFSKKGQRKVSSFVGQELLYDYMTGQLDDERKKSVDEFIKINKDAQTDLQKIRHGLNYTDRLSQTVVSEALIEKVSSPTTYTEVLLQKIRFDEWSPALRMGVEATVVALGIVVLAILIPWHKVMDLKFGAKEVVLTEMGKSYTTKNVVDNETSPKDEVVFPDEGEPAPSTTSTTMKVAAQTPVIPSTTSTTVTTSTTTTLAVAKGKKATATKAAAEVSATEGKRQGELYRGEIKVTNVEAITPKLVEQIVALGGRKAGQVDLGWSKNGDSSYFHFTIPAKEYDQLLALFAQYGKLKIQKEKHERVMPEGIMRLIITVNEK